MEQSYCKRKTGPKRAQQSPKGPKMKMKRKNRIKRNSEMLFDDGQIDRDYCDEIQDRYCDSE